MDVWIANSDLENNSADMDMFKWMEKRSGAKCCW